jgi:hypothetical protein
MVGEFEEIGLKSLILDTTYTPESNMAFSHSSHWLPSLTNSANGKLLSTSLETLIAVISASPECPER